jgi:hypothetical protein
MSIGRSFIKGPRFAFRDTSTVCVPCIFGERYRRGAVHTCADACGVCGGSGFVDCGGFECQCDKCEGGRVVPAAGLEPETSAL